jgi:hypothetical protein
MYETPQKLTGRRRHKMSLAGQRHIVMGMVGGLVLSLLILVLCAGMTHGKAYLSEDQVVPAHYPRKFDGLGHIDRIGREAVVIDDTMHSLSHHVRYATPRSKYGFRSAFRVGAYVGFILDSEEKVTSLWLIE